MKLFCCSRRNAALLFSVLLLLGPATGRIVGKEIRLRNQVISPSVGNSQTLTATVEAPQSALLLVQLDRVPSAETRAILKAMGVELLAYVPDETYIARLTGVTEAQLRAIPGVAWTGPYHRAFKIHRALLPTGTESTVNQALANTPVEVSVLVAPGVPSRQMADLRATFQSIVQETFLRCGVILKGRANSVDLDSIASSDAVLWIEPAPRMKLVDEVSSKLVAGDGGPNELLSRLLGFDGDGVKVAVADSGLDTGDAQSMHPDLLGRTPSFFHYGALTDAADEHSHGTHVAGIIAGNGATGELDENGALYGLGVAPGAEIITQRIFDGLGGYEPPSSFEQLTRDATRAGAVIGSNSWGDDTQGRYDISAMEFDALVRDADTDTPGDQEYILEFSAGNAGPGTRTIGSPAVAKNVIATGASGNDRPDFVIYADGVDTIADFSSRGPCEDGRIKPDVVAPGTWIASLQSASATDQYAWLPISPNYQYQGGTSQSGPHVSGAAAVFVQYYRASHGGRTPSPALAKAALINSALDLDDTFGTAPVPNMDEGWGAVDLTMVLDPERSFDYLDQTELLAPGAIYEKRILVALPEQEFKVTLAYTDVPGFPGALPALVNDLDLEVVTPAGDLLRGNSFLLGQSVPGGNADRVNNVEAVHLLAPRPGEYTVHVRAAAIAQDARADTPAVDQDFALVISAAMPHAGSSYISLDRGAYGAPRPIEVTVIDPDASASNSLNVLARSTTEVGGEVVLLHRLADSGVFTGAVYTATGPAAADGLLQVAHNDSLEVVYADASTGQSRIATAQVDLVVPTISGVQSTNSFGRATISWVTDEPANSIVIYGTNASSLLRTVINQGFGLEHALIIEGLIPGVTYYYQVVSADAAGNASTNNNGGSLFTFQIAPNPPVLLIDSYQDPLFGAPPLEGYTLPLEQSGMGFQVWNAGDLGEPTLDVLKSYRAVVWRVPELTGTWSASERLSISNYLHSGGSLFVASMELLSRLQETGEGDAFIREVLHVQSFIPDPDSNGASDIFGAPLSPVGDGLEIVMDYAAYDAIWLGLLGPDISDTIVPGQGATQAIQNGFGDTIGLQWQGTNVDSGRLVFLSFPLDAVPMDSGVNDRIRLVRNALAFLVPDRNGGTITLDSSSYNLPSTVNVTLASEELAGAGSVNVTVTCQAVPEGMSVTLVESSRGGFFQGTFKVVSETNSPSAGELRTHHGDVIKVDYAPGSGEGLTTSAVIDTEGPEIFNVSSEPDYVQATISWTTSEMSDALVQFGESPLLGRTAYDPGPSPDHALTLTGLLPDRVYYFRVVSRDIAGNPTEDDNGGALYTLRTLEPLLPPWSDSLDSGATNWSVITPEESQAQWELGAPSSGLVAAPHSPPAVWSSNLRGEPTDFVESFLVSPAIFLTGGTNATLVFWHAYDFPDLTGYDLEFGELSIVADNAAPVTLAQYADASGDWVIEEIDLTPYLGKVVYLAWHYVLFSIETLPRYGWVVDDIAISVSGLPNPPPDTDSDGMSDQDELVAGTDPANPESVMTVSASIQDSQAFRFEWSAMAGRLYRLVSSVDGKEWTPASEWQPSSTQATMSLTLPAPAPGQNHLFRLEVKLP